jgi:hypothetical protein
VAISQVTVTGTFVDFSGQAMTGRIIFTPTPTAVNDAGADLVYMSRPVSVLLTTGGRLSVDLAATDDTDGNPVGFTYTVTEEFDNFAGGRTYPISLPAANSPVDLADISPESSASAGTVVWAGMPVGGTVGQFMVKTGVDNYDAGWSTMADQYLQGTGFPNGVVTAPVGSIYTDTAATNGAIRWIKATGSGNTGWRVEYGDTGWRNIVGSIYAGPSLAANFPTVNALYMRRIGMEVKFRFRGNTTGGALVGLNAVAEMAVDLPAGWRSLEYATLGSGKATQAASLVSTSSLTTLSLVTEQPPIHPSTSPLWIAGPFSIMADYTTDDAWPTTLIGTAV